MPTETLMALIEASAALLGALAGALLQHWLEFTRYQGHLEQEKALATEQTLQRME